MRNLLPTTVVAFFIVSLLGCNPSKQEQAALVVSKGTEFDPFKNKPRTSSLIDRAHTEDTNVRSTTTGTQASSAANISPKGSFMTVEAGAGLGTAPRGGDFGLASVSGADKNFDLSLLEVEADDKNYKRAFDLGESYLGRGQYEQALVAFADAQNLNPKNYSAYVGEAFCHFRKEDYGKALAAIDFAIRYAPKMTALRGHRGHIKLRMNDLPGAVNEFTAVLDVEPGDAGSRTIRAQIYGMMTNYTAAIADYDVAIKQNPTDPALLLNRGVTYFKIRRQNEAIADATAALKLNPQLLDGYFLRAVAKVQLNDAVGGRPDFDQAVKLGLDSKLAAMWRPAFYPNAPATNP